MLRVQWMASGEELLQLSPEEFLTEAERAAEATNAGTISVAALKRHLHRRLGLPPRFRQKIFAETDAEAARNGETALKDTELLVPPVTLQLLILSICPLPSEEHRKFFDATEQDCQESVERFLQIPCDPNLLGKHQETALHCAAYRNSVSCCRLLIEARGELDTTLPVFGVLQRGSGHTPLHVACRFGHPEIVKLLLEARADKNKAHPMDGITPLYIAAAEHQLESLQLLIQHQADVNQASTEHGLTPLHLAAEDGALQVLDSLLAAKAHLDRQDLRGATALHLACEEGHVGVAYLLIEAQANLNLPENTRGSTPLHVACKKNQLATAQLLLGAMAALDPVDCRGSTPLRVACQRRAFALARLLMARSADVDKALRTERARKLDTSVSPNVLTLIAHDDANVGERSISKKRRSAHEIETLETVAAMVRMPAPTAVSLSAVSLACERAYQWDMVLNLLERGRLDRLLRDQAPAERADGEVKEGRTGRQRAAELAMLTAACRACAAKISPQDFSASKMHITIRAVWFKMCCRAL
eukprot:s1162_g3.t1